jgi:hypothetical protein
MTAQKIKNKGKQLVSCFFNALTAVAISAAATRHFLSFSIFVFLRKYYLSLFPGNKFYNF